MEINDKKHFETLAAFTLQQIKGYPVGREIFGERPDLQYEDMNIGVEVTRGISQDEGLFYALVHEYFGKGYSIEEIRKEMEKSEKNKRFSDALSMEDDHIVISPFRGSVPTSLFWERLQKRLEAKIAKLHNGYRRFSENGLYVFTHHAVLKEEEFSHFFAQNPGYARAGYDVYYLDCIDCVYAFYGKTEALETFLLPPADRARMVRQVPAFLGSTE